MSDNLPLLVRLKEFAATRRITLPVFSTVARQLQEAARSDTYDITAIERAIEGDPVLAAEVLRAANSGFFGGLSEIRTIRAAIVRLGFRQVANLAFMATEKSRYTARQPALAAMMTDLWQHASACAMASEWIAKRLRLTQWTEEAFIGGLLHDIGKLFLLRVLDDMMTETPQDGPYPPELVKEVVTQVHADVGHELLRSWHLPAVYLTIVRDHHVEPVDTTNVPLLIVRLANQGCRKAGLALDTDDSVALAATVEAAALGMSEVALAELEIILEDVRGVAAA